MEILSALNTMTVKLPLNSYLKTLAALLQTHAKTVFYEKKIVHIFNDTIAL